MTDIQRAMLGDHEAAARLTGEAAQMVMERLEALKDGSTTD